MKQENVAVLWVVVGFGLSFVVLIAAQPWWIVPIGMLATIVLAPLYVK